jgi:hypothetical protein
MPRAFGKLAFPNSRNPPPLTPEKIRNSAIARPILVYLDPPRLGIGLWGDILAAVMAVPKASINEYDNLGRSPHEVRSSEKGLVPAPSD